MVGGAEIAGDTMIKARDQVRTYIIGGGVDDYRLKAGRILWRLKVALRLKPPDALPAESRLKAWWAQ